MTIVARDVDTLVAAVAAASGDVLVTIPPDLSPLTMRLVSAAIAGLAIEYAPRRINAVAPSRDADAGAVDAAIRYLAAATSTTGEIVAISACSRPVAG